MRPVNGATRRPSSAISCGCQTGEHPCRGAAPVGRKRQNPPSRTWQDGTLPAGDRGGGALGGHVHA